MKQNLVKHFSEERKVKKTRPKKRIKKSNNIPIEDNSAADDYLDYLDSQY